MHGFSCVEQHMWCGVLVLLLTQAHLCFSTTDLCESVSDKLLVLLRRVFPPRAPLLLPVAAVVLDMLRKACVDNQAGPHSPWRVWRPSS